MPIDTLISYRWALPVADSEGVSGLGHAHRSLWQPYHQHNPRDAGGYAGEKTASKIYVGNTILKEIVRTYADCGRWFAGCVGGRQRSPGDRGERWKRRGIAQRPEGYADFGAFQAMKPKA